MYNVSSFNVKKLALFYRITLLIHYILCTTYVKDHIFAVPVIKFLILFWKQFIFCKIFTIKFCLFVNKCFSLK